MASFNVHFGTSFDCCGSFMRGVCGNFSHLYVDCCWVYMAKFKPRYMWFRRWSNSHVENIARFLAIPCSLVKSLENHFRFILLALLSLCCFASLTSSVHKDPTTKKLQVGSVVLKVSAQVLCAWDWQFLIPEKLDLMLRNLFSLNLVQSELLLSGGDGWKSPRVFVLVCVVGPPPLPYSPTCSVLPLAGLYSAECGATKRNRQRG